MRSELRVFLLLFDTERIFYILFISKFEKQSMDSPHERSPAEFSLTMHTVKLTVNFPCKMNLSFDGKQISPQVQKKSNIFTFNKEVKVSSTSQEEIEINVYLNTEKGGNILAGVIPLSQSLLKEKEGQKIKVNLRKCLDASSFCQMKINHVWIKRERPQHLAKSSIGGIFNKVQTKRDRGRSTLDIVETKSDYQPVLQKKRAFQRLGSPHQLYKSNQYHFQRHEKNQNPARVLSKLNVYNIRDRQLEDEMKQTKTLGGGVRNRRQPKAGLKKPIVSETENNLKLDVLKYKMKFEESQKALTQKNKNIKQFKDKILELERKLLEKQYVQEQLSAKQTAIKILEDRITNLTSQNNSLRQNAADQQKSLSDMKDTVKFDLLKNKQQFEKKEHALRFEISSLKNKISEIQLQNSNKGAQLIKAKKYIEDLENSSEQKIFQHDQIIQDLKKTNSKHVGEYVKKNTELQQIITDLNQKVSSFQAFVNQQNDNLGKRQQQIQSNENQLHLLENEKAQLLIMKSDYLALQKKYNKLEENLKQEQKQHSKNINLKNKELNELQDDHKKTTLGLESKLNLSNEKNKEYKKKIADLENNILLEKSQYQKLKKNNDKNEKVILNLNSKIDQTEKEIRAYEVRIQTLEKQNHEKINLSSHSQSLMKMQIQHHKENIARISKEYQQVEGKYIHFRDQTEVLRADKTRLQNKIQLLEDSNTRSSEYLKQKKAELQLKESEFKESLKNLSNMNKSLEESDKAKQKELNNWEIKELSYKNKMDKIQKQLDDAENRNQKFEKVIIPKYEKDKQALSIEREKVKEKLHEAQEENKFITSQRAKLESETNKNSKINTVLNQQKINAQNEINKLKNALTRSEKKQHNLQNDIKNITEENKKQILKIQMLTKQCQKNKEIVSDIVNNIIGINNRKSRDSFGLEQSRKRTSVDNFFSNEPSSTPQHYDIRRMSQIIDSNNKQQQNTIIGLQESIKQYKSTVEGLEKQICQLSMILKQNDEKNQDTIDKMSEQLEGIHEKLFTVTNEYQDRVSKLQTQINKKDKDLRLTKEALTNLKYEIQALKKRQQMTQTDTQANENRLLNEIQQLSAEVHFHQMSVQNLEGNKKELEDKIYALEEENRQQREQIAKKQKQISELFDRNNRSKYENDDLVKSKKEMFEQILYLKEENNALKDEISKTKELLKQEEDSKSKLQEFTNSVIKQKENIVKVQIEVSAKVIELEGKIIQLKSNVENLEDSIKEKDNQIAQFKTSQKENIQKIKILEGQFSEQKTNAAQLLFKLQEKEKKCLEQESQIREINAKYDSIMQKYKKDISVAKEQYEDVRQESANTSEQKNKKIIELEDKIEFLENTISQHAKELSQNQEIIFFEKQKLSISESNNLHLKKQNSDLQLIINNLNHELRSATQEIAVKEEALYEYSGRIYEYQQKLQGKEIQKQRELGDLDMDWQNRHDQACQQYEYKLEILEKERQYFNQKLLQEEQQRRRLQEQKKALEENHDRDLISVQKKEKEQQTTKMLKINEKNKEIEKLKEQIQRQKSQSKKQQIQFRKKQEELLRKNETIVKLEKNLSDHEQLINEVKSKYDEQINELRNKELSFKNYQEQLRTVQWQVQRQTKKATQGFIQKIVMSCPEIKQKLAQPMKSFEQSIASAVTFKV